MPFKSKAQMRFLFAKHPGAAGKFASETTKGKRLPDHLAKMEALRRRKRRK